MALFQGHILKSFERAMKITETFSIIPFRWNKDKQCMIPASKKTQKAFKIGTFFQTLLLLVSLAQAAYSWKTLNLLIKSYTIFTFGIVLTGMVSSYTNKSYSITLCNLLNSMQNFEQTWYYGYFTTYWNKEARLIDFAISVLVLITIVGPITYYTQVFVYPCMPSLLGYQFLKECQDASNISPDWMIENQFVHKLLILVICCANMQFYTGGLMLHHWFLFYFGYGFRTYLKEYYQYENCNSIFFTDMQTSNFLIFNCRYVLKIGKINQRNRATIMGFRNIQLMLLLHKEILGNKAIMAVVAQLVILNTSGLYNACMMASGLDADSANMPWQIKFWSVNSFAITTFEIMVACLYLGKVYQASFEGNERVQNTKRQKEFRRFLCSMPVQKIYFGRLSFFERTTSLTIQNFALDQTVNLLLVE